MFKKNVSSFLFILIISYTTCYATPQFAINAAHQNINTHTYSEPKRKYDCFVTLNNKKKLNIKSRLFENNGHYLSLTDDEMFTINTSESFLYAIDTKLITCDGVDGISKDGFWHFKQLDGTISLYKDQPQKGKATLIEKKGVFYSDIEFDFENIINDRPEILEYYQSLKSRKIWGTSLMWVGLGSVLAGLVLSFDEEEVSTGRGETTTQPSFSPSPLLFIGAGISWAGYFINVSAKNGEYKAIMKYNL